MEQQRMSWAALNAWLLTNDNEQQLEEKLMHYKEQGRLSRAMRVYGRLSAVRRMREIREIRRKCKRD